MSNRLVLCLWILSVVALAAQTEVEDVALRQAGGMPVALASVENLRFSAQKACDGKAATAWVSGTEFPVWLRVEWRAPVEVREIAFRQFPSCPYDDTGAIGDYAVEVLEDGQWREAAAGRGEGVGLDEEAVHPLEPRVRTTAVRLLIRSAAKARVGVSELRVTGPKVVLPGEWVPYWKGMWIWAEPSLYVPHREPLTRYMRRSFDIDDPGTVKEAWLLACAFDRLNQFWVNNRPALKHPSYHGGSLREARIRRVPAEWLVKGENVLAARVDDLYESGSHGLLAELVLLRTDGSREVIATDGEWLGQEDQGTVPNWRKPGFSESRWVPCRVRTWPNTRWHWLWNVPRPTVAPADTLRLLQLRVDPQPVAPGGVARVRAVVECTQPLSRDYAVVVRLGQPSFWRNHDFELWGAVLSPEEARTGEWTPGKHEVSVTVPVPDYAPSETPARLLLSTKEGAAGLVSNVPGTRADAYGLHFTVAVDRGPSRPLTGGEFPRCEVRSRTGSPVLHIDGEPVAPILWSSSYGNYRRYSEYAKTGVKLFRPIVQGTPIPAPGEEDEHYDWWLAQVDRMLTAAVSMDPQVRLLPAVWMDPNPQWLFDRPSEQLLGGRGSLVIPLSHLVPDRGQVRPTFMSQAWRRAGAAGLKRLVTHLRTSAYASNVIGVCFMAGRAGENYWGGNEYNVFINGAGAYDCKPREEWQLGDFCLAARLTFRDFLVRTYGSDKALRRAWQRDDISFDDVLQPALFPAAAVNDILCWTGKPAAAGSVRDPLQPGVGTLPMDYFQCYAEAMIDTFAAWGRAVKEASDGRLITGCYYGYAIPQVFTSVPGFHGHTAVARACRTPSLDFYVSPSEYNRARRPGTPYWGHNIVDSLRLHDKLWLFEQDTRTYIAEHMPKTFSRRNTLEILKRDAAAALTRYSGWWWYEFAEGQGGSRAREWFVDPEIAAFASYIRRVYSFALTLPDHGPSSQIAVFYHGETLTAQDVFAPTAQINIPIARLTLVDAMQRIGAPFDFYNLAGIPVLRKRGMLDQYRMCLFLNPFYLTAEERGWLDVCRGGGRTLLWLWGPGIARPDSAPSPPNVSETTAIPGISWLHRKAPQVYRVTDASHPVTQGLSVGQEFAAVPFHPQATWARFGNDVWPLLFVDPEASGPETRVLANWVLDGEPQSNMGALCVRRVTDDGRGSWTSMYAAIPLLGPEMLRNVARFAGVRILREANDVLFAGRHFVAVHTGDGGARGELALSRETGVYDVFGRRKVADKTTAVELALEPNSTVMFFLGDPRAFAEAVGARD